MVDTLKMYPNRGVSSYGLGVATDERTNNTQVTIITHPVDIVNVIDVGLYSENTEAHAVNTQDEGWYGFKNSVKDPRSLFITSDDIDSAR